MSDELGACLAIPGITAHRAVLGDGPVAGRVLLVHGVLGGVGSMSAQPARRAGATVIGTVRRAAHLEQAGPGTVARDDPDVVGRIRAIAPDGVDRVVEVSLSDNADLDVAVLAVGVVLAAYASRDERPRLPFWPMLFGNVTQRLLGSSDFPAEATREAAEDLTAAAADGALSVPVGLVLPLDEIDAAHDRVDAGGAGRVLLALP